MDNKMFQVSTLQALVAGYTRGVITVQELESLDNVGLGTFDGVDGEMILLDGVCYRARQDGSVVRPTPDAGVPFASAASVKGGTAFELEGPLDIDSLKHELTCKLDEAFALNSMHVATVSGTFDSVSARSESAYRADHVTLKDMLATTQREFIFEKLAAHSYASTTRITWTASTLPAGTCISCQRTVPGEATFSTCPSSTATP